MSGKVANTIITNGLVFYADVANKASYSGNNNTWNDISKNGTIGTLVQNPTFNSGNGGSLTFNGTDTYVTGTDSKGLLNVGADGSVTIEAFIYPTTSGTFSYVFSYGCVFGSATPSYAIGLSNTDTVTVRTNNGDSLGGTAVSINQWSSISAVFVAGGNVTRYINGVSSFVSTRPTISPSTGDWCIGGFGTAYGRFTGRIACIRVYNRSLSATEVLQNHNTIKPRFGL